MKRLLLLLLFPAFASAQYSTYDLVRDSISKIAQRKTDSVLVVLQAQVNAAIATIPTTSSPKGLVTSASLASKPDTSVFLPAVRSSIATKTSFDNVSDSVLRNAGWAPTMADLKMWKVAPNKVVLMVGKTAIGDNLGGFYRWDTTATGTDETVYLNIINSNISSAGRWVRIFQRARTLPGGGILVNNGGVKTLFLSGATNSSGDIILNLTDDNNSTGNAVFTEIWSIKATSTTDANGPGNAVQSYRKSLTTNLKVLTYGFYKANAITIALGLLYNPFASVGAGTVIQFEITGINSNG